MSHDRWLHQLRNLNKARNNAPHKPLLLLVFLDLVETGEYAAGPLFCDAPLAYRFNTYAKVATHRRTARPDVRYPFHHLTSQGFWTAHVSSGEPSAHRVTTAYVLPDTEFVAACRDPQFRHDARMILVLTHFEAAERNALYHLLGIPAPEGDAASIDAYFDKPNDAENAGRTARFRLNVVPMYDYTCALTRYCMTTISSGAIVDAAHIHQFARSRNNDPSNGLALCKNAHWQFDNGLWTLDDDYCVMVVDADKFVEHSPNQKSLRDYQGERIHLPQNPTYWPSKEHLAWHRKTKFNRAD